LLSDVSEKNRESIMANVVHRSHITITREMGPTRKAEIKGFAEPVFYGVHGGIKDFYKIDPEEEHAATLDHIVGAVGG
jgi:hypothetical protein